MVPTAGWVIVMAADTKYGARDTKRRERVLGPVITVSLE